VGRGVFWVAWPLGKTSAGHPSDLGAASVTSNRRPMKAGSRGVPPDDREAGWDRAAVRGSAMEGLGRGAVISCAFLAGVGPAEGC
jgi:hypothetical protein